MHIDRREKSFMTFALSMITTDKTGKKALH